MALRFVLVGLVASLGCEWPSGAELIRVVQSAQVWIATQWQDWQDIVVSESGREGTAGPAIETHPGPAIVLMTKSPISAVVSVGPTVAIEAILADRGVARVVAEVPAFAASTESVNGAAMIEVVEESPAVADTGFETVVGAMASAFADEPADGWAEDLVEETSAFDAVVGEMATAFAEEAEEDQVESAVLATNREPAGLDGMKAVEAEPSESKEDASPRGERISTAVRLTGQAVQAWISVLQQRTPGGFERP